MPHKTPYTLDDLLHIIAALRDPVHGCPWDIQQHYATIVPYTIAEAYEVADAVARENMYDLRDELGDLLLQVVYYSQFAKEDQYFSFSDVVHAICQKMIRRHPHVFGNDTQHPQDIAQVNQQWENIKQQEKQPLNSQQTTLKTSVARIKSDVPALQFAYSLGDKAAHYAFDWPDYQSVVDKIREECEEITIQNADLEEEIGDLMFAMVQLCRKAKLDPENTLRKAGLKFQQRFVAMSEQEPLPETLDAWEKRWEKVKKQ